MAVGRPLQRRGQLPHLPRLHHVHRHEQRHPGRGRLGQPAFDPGRDPLAFEGEHHPFEDPFARHWMSLLAASTASLRASCAGTLSNSADSTAVRTSWLTSTFFGIGGTMSW